jgi:hypothetical protein
MLSFFNNHSLNLIPTFCMFAFYSENLFFIKNWQRENNEYLMRGYARDYLPSEIR